MEHATSINRACEACKRKKTKCDGRKPCCSLCLRIRAGCVYPQRKSRIRDRHRSISTIADDSSTLGSEADARFTANESNGLGPSAQAQGPEVPVNSNRTQWANFQDNYYFAGTVPSAEAVIPVFQASPTDQEMLDYLSQTLPDIWMTNPHSQNTDPRPMMLDNNTVAGTTKVLNDYRQDQVPSPNLTDTEHPPSDDIDPSLEQNAFGVPPSVIDDLIDLYFKRMQVFVPLFHRPTFSKNYLQDNAANKYASLSNDSVFILNSMMALSARFSTAPYLSNEQRAEQCGSQFARKAQAIYQEVVQSSTPLKPTLPWLQGCILLAYYNQTCRPALGCDLTVATCIRFAYDLGLHMLDGDSEPDNLSAADWAKKEEQRRAWWSIWELDTFECISARRPFTINWNRVHVLLPVSDKAWFANTPVKSTALSPDILQCWKALKDSPNEDERAWFLVSNYIMAHALGLCQQSKVSTKNVNNVETVVSCFSLLFHEKFRSAINNLTFNENNYAKSNWIVMARCMIQSSKIAICILESRSSSELIANPFRDFDGASRDKKKAPSCNSMEKYSQPASELFRIYHAWSPDFIGFAPPTMACLVLGPRAIMLRYARHLRKDQNGGDTSQPSIQEDLLVLILRHFGHYWNIGLCLLDFVRAFKDG